MARKIFRFRTLRIRNGRAPKKISLAISLYQKLYSFSASAEIDDVVVEFKF
jgi:hypothetical protein